MAVTSARTPRVRLSVWAAGVVLAVAMLGHHVLVAPPAAASCTLTTQDDQYINLLGQKNMIHGADFNDCHMVAEGRWFADQVRNSPDPLGTARSLVQMVKDTTPMNEEQAEWEVEAAIFVYAPEMIPTIKGQFAQPPPD
jgi:hypothetical protein